MILLVCSSLLAQEEETPVQRDEIRTLFGQQRGSGGYGALSVGYSEIDQRSAILFGARGAWIIGHSFSIALGGTGFLNEPHYDISLSENVNLAGGYGGLIAEPILLPMSPVHLSFPVLAGIGGVAYAVTGYEDWEYYTANYVEDSDVFLVLEPGAELEFNMMRYFRLSLGAYYRYTSRLHLLNTPANALQGMSFAINLKFGAF